MKILRRASLRGTLISAFTVVVTLVGVLLSAVFIYFLVQNMRNAEKNKIQETARVADTFIQNTIRGLEIYSDLIASDQNFGQFLSFDSAFGVQQKVEEFRSMSKADVVAFLPQPQEYVSIKDEIFLSSLDEIQKSSLPTNTFLNSISKPSGKGSPMGWINMDQRPYLFVAKPVLHFGRNMGTILLARACSDSFAKEIASTTGTEIILFNKSSIFGSSFSNLSKSFSLPNQASLAQTLESAELQENYTVNDTPYLSLFRSIQTIDGNYLATLGIQVSSKSIDEARNRTLIRVLAIALVLTLLSAILGSILASNIAGPLQKITTSISSIIEKGDLGIRIRDRFSGEIEILSSTFNRLLGQLQTAHEKLAASERRMKEELETASSVQEMLFPKRGVVLSNLELASFLDPSSETGGDWFGYDQDRNRGHVTVLIGDVTGHGVPAALITAITNGFFKGVAETEDSIREAFDEIDKLRHSQSNDSRRKIDPVLERLKDKQFLSTADLLEMLNEVIMDCTSGSLLMTFFASIYDAEKKRLLYANAGHNRPFICRNQGDRTSVSILPSEPSQRLGEKKGVKFMENSIDLSAGDTIVWYTDGILECENKSGEMYGKRRLMNHLRQAHRLSPEELRDQIIQDAYEFFGETPRKDDITVVLGKVL